MTATDLLISSDSHVQVSHDAIKAHLATRYQPGRRVVLEALGVRYKSGVENIMWSSDYPHPVSSFPDSRRIVAQCVAALPERERELITSGNAKRVWNL